KGAVSPYGKIVQLAGGAVLMAVYFQFGGERGNESWLFRSTDGGRTWGDPSLLGRHFNETALAAFSGGRLVAAMRSEKGGHLAVIRSRDGGRTWTEPAVVTRDNEHPADLVALSSGGLLLTYGVRVAPMGVHARTSRDGGVSWSDPAILASDAPNRDCGYPSSVEIAPGKILTVYYQVDDLGDAPRSARAKAIVWTPDPRPR
ncbi:MAG: sialidase family protein, partial [Bryobacteraceae bacterium]